MLGEVHWLSELFTEPDRPLVIYHLMYGRRRPALPMHAMDRRLQRDRTPGQNVDFGSWPLPILMPRRMPGTGAGPGSGSDLR
jgi:hypothetical protein